MASPETAAGDMPLDALPADVDDRRCFICLCDHDPSDPPNSWVDPCPCTLEAHRDCMESWITDCERSNKPLRCPICKYNIELVTPFDPLLSTSRSVIRGFTKVSPYVLLGATSVGVGVALEAYGIAAMWAFAGSKATWNFLLGPQRFFSLDRVNGGLQARALVLMGAAPAMLGNKMFPNGTTKLLSPLLTFVSIYNAHRDPHYFSWPPSPMLAVVTFPALRLMYYNLMRDTLYKYEDSLNRKLLGLPPRDTTQNNGGENARNRRNNNRNPVPRAEGGILGLLQNLIDLIDVDDEDDEDFEDRIQPRDAPANIQLGNDAFQIELAIEEDDGEGFVPNGAETDGEDEDEAPPEVQRAEIENAIRMLHEMRDDNEDEVAGGAAVEGGEEGDWNDILPPVEPRDHQGAEGADNPPFEPRVVHENPVFDRNNIRQIPPIPPPQPLAEPDNQHEAPRAPPAGGVPLGIVLHNIANSLVGTFALPFISYAMGEVLKRLILPRSWTANSGYYRPGLLQQQWGRSLIGGTLFLVAKDCLRVLTKQRKVYAMDHRQVKNVDRERRRRSG